MSTYLDQYKNRKRTILYDYTLNIHHESILSTNYTAINIPLKKKTLVPHTTQE